MKEHSVNKLDNFIGAWYLEDTSICDELIEFWNSSLNKGPGFLSTGIVDKSTKDSIDTFLPYDKEIYLKYITALQTVLLKYIKKYTWCNDYSPFRTEEGINLQYYPPKGGYHKWHTERFLATYPNATRHLVFMTYLNDVIDQGETEFFHQKLKIKPEKGLTVIWPADWTFTHRGVASPTQEKFIATGWYNFISKT
jgi:hypothetical protein